MGKKIDWEQVTELTDKIKEQGLSLAEGQGSSACQFGGSTS